MEVNISNRGTLFLLDYYINIIGLVFIDAIGFLQRLIAKTNEFGSIDFQCIYMILFLSFFKYIFTHLVLDVEQ